MVNNRNKYIQKINIGYIRDHFHHVGSRMDKIEIVNHFITCRNIHIFRYNQLFWQIIELLLCNISLITSQWILKLGVVWIQSVSYFPELNCPLKSPFSEKVFPIKMIAETFYRDKSS